MSAPETNPIQGHMYPIELEESDDFPIVQYGSEFSRARFMCNQAERSIRFQAQNQVRLGRYAAADVAAGIMKNEDLARIESDTRDMAIGIHTYAEFKERWPFIDTKPSSDLGVDFAKLPFSQIVEEDMDKLAHEVEHGNPISSMGQEQRAAAYGFLEQHPDISALTLEDFQEIHSILDPCVVPNLLSAVQLKSVAEQMGYREENGTQYHVRKRAKFGDAVERALRRNSIIESYLESDAMAPEVGIAFGQAMQELSCVRTKVTTRTRNRPTPYSAPEIIHKFFRKAGLHITQGLPLFHIAADQNEKALKFFEPENYVHSASDIPLPRPNKLESLNGVLAPCVIANLITGARLIAKGRQKLRDLTPAS